MKKTYIVIPSNIRESIISGRREKYGPEQISVYIKGMNSVYNPLEEIELSIGVKIVESVPGEVEIGRNISIDGVVRKRRSYGMVMAFPEGDVSDESIQKAINYIIEYAKLEELPKITTLKPVNVNTIKK